MSQTPIVSLGKMKRILKLLIQIKPQVNIPASLWGHHGIGKTQIVREIAKELQYKCVVLNLANQSPEDLLGQIDGKGGNHRPKWLEETKQPVIYFLDEMNRAPKYVLQCMFNFLNEGRLHQYEIKSQDVIVSANNPQNSTDYEVTEFDDSAWTSRQAHFGVQPTKEEFVNYLSHQTKNDIIQKAISKSAELVDIPHTRLTPTVGPDNRALEKISRLFDILNEQDIEDVGADIISAMIGMDAAQTIMHVYKDQKKNEYDFKTLLKCKKTDDFPFKHEDIAVFDVMIQSMSHYLIKKKNDQEELLADDLNDNEKRTMKMFFEFCPEDLKVVFLDSTHKISNSLACDVLGDYRKLARHIEKVKVS